VVSHRQGQAQFDHRGEAIGLAAPHETPAMIECAYSSAGHVRRTAGIPDEGEQQKLTGLVV